MNDADQSAGRIKLWTRVAAGLLLLMFLTLSMQAIYAILRGRSLSPPIPWYEAAILIPALMWLIPCVASVAFRGRWPEYWLDMERRTREGRARARQRPRSIAALWYWKPRSPRLLGRICLTLLIMSAVGHAIAITLIAVTQDIHGPQLLYGC
jgi:hypothetical protein